MVKLKKLLLVFGVCFIPSLASVSASSGVNEFERKKMETLSSSPKLKHNVIKDLTNLSKLI
ncbi:hypothetical protein [Vibrio sp. 624788]|uniref:hypothetical protein n=1 Tax=Vibrio sp. 624788 TaxID=1234362 RepID=UPI000305AFC9|nr:hypothetical protein [Vibrio sp. 624788]